MQKHSVSPEYKFQNLEELKRKSRPYVLNPKFSTPTSLPLYFYFVYQLLQESNLLKDCGPVSKDTFIFNLIIIMSYLFINMILKYYVE